MKRNCLANWIVALCIVVFTASSARAVRDVELKRASSAVVLSPQAARKAVGTMSRRVVTALKQRDMMQLSRYVHPKMGLRFSPYTSAGKSELVFSVAQVRHLNRSNKRYLRGTYASNAGPMRLTWNAYRTEFVFPHDYTRAPETQYNSEISSGAYEVMRDFYPNQIFVRYLFSGFNPKREGMDWRALWLVWNRSGSTWKLVGLVNDEWTP